ncbi:Flavin-dependent tryptophan halogenase PrnA [Thalassocella blandensis]|nr:Flavin-dependent tryptophan halogenase PrnA [Thalassocella blandensis]
MKPNKIVIVGGGAAGWMTANLMAHEWGGSGISIVVVESSSIGTVGVGEGSTPFLREFFAKLNICEDEWMPACNATFKNGIRFPGWSVLDSSYFHPFYVEQDAENAIQFFKASFARRMGFDLVVNPDAYFLATQIANQRRAPIRADGVQSNTDYGYHFDSDLLGRFLKKKAIARGVQYIDDKVLHVNLNDSGDVETVRSEKNGEIAGDFFVDCSGFKGLIIQQSLGERVISFKSKLFNDSAVAIPTPLNNSSDSGLLSETISTAISNGWVWQIPLSNRFGNGYVYCSDFLSEDQAELQLREFLSAHGDESPARHLHWTPGRISQHWKRNCVAIGLSQGFLEPLEAPMMRIIQHTCESFIDNFQNGSFTGQYRDTFNAGINQLIDGTSDYLQAHYKASSRSDSEYWVANRSNMSMSDELKGLLSAWISAASFDEVLAEIADSQVYHKTSWYCLFAGKGCFRPSRQVGPQKLVDQRNSIMSRLELEARRYMKHSEYLKSICS